MQTSDVTVCISCLHQNIASFIGLFCKRDLNSLSATDVCIRLHEMSSHHQALCVDDVHCAWMLYTVCRWHTLCVDDIHCAHGDRLHEMSSHHQTLRRGLFCTNSHAFCANVTHCNTLQRTATHRNTLQHTATHCNTLHHTATHCNKSWHKIQHTTQSARLQSTTEHYLCICVYMYMCIYMHIRIHVHMHKCIYAYRYTCTAQQNTKIKICI